MIENSIEISYNELSNFTEDSSSYLKLYSNVKHEKLQEIFCRLHYEYIKLFTRMNTRLPSPKDGAYFWAAESKQLIQLIDTTMGLFHSLKGTKLEFNIDDNYYELFEKCHTFLVSNGSTLPGNMDKIILYYAVPIFKMQAIVNVKNGNSAFSYSEKFVDRGSYAKVVKYHDTFYDKVFAVKKAEKNLSSDEQKRFKVEYEIMKKLSSPYILEVYNFNESDNSYVMEFMDCTLASYIKDNNTKITIEERKNIVYQILRAFKYIHSKAFLHRDISPSNILLKKYDDVHVIKISDFGLVKLPDSTLTRVDTEIKGSFNDPFLTEVGFNNYEMSHEIYALTRIIYFVMTGRVRMRKQPYSDNENFNNLLTKGINKERSQRFKSVQQLNMAFQKIDFH